MSIVAILPISKTASRKVCCHAGSACCSPPGIPPLAQRKEPPRGGWRPRELYLKTGLKTRPEQGYWAAAHPPVIEENEAVSRPRPRAPAARLPPLAAPPRTRPKTVFSG